MNKIVDFDKIGYVAATFEVDATTKAYLTANHVNAKTGNVDINGLNFGVKLNSDGTVGFGAADQTTADALLGIVIAYEMDGFATIQIKGGADNVPTVEAVDAGRQLLAVDNTGKIVVLADAITESVLTRGGRETIVAKPSTASNLYASIIL